MQFGSRRLVRGALLSILTVGALGLAACGSNSNNAGPVNGKDCKNIGVLLPESASSARWEGQDRPQLQKAIEAAIPGAKVTITNANGNDDTQISQAEADLTAGACILVVAPHDKAKAATIVADAKKDKVPVIAYDRLIASPDLDYYVSFDGVSVGVAQGQYIVDHYKDPQYGVSDGHNKLVMINGSQDDNNAVLFKQGAHQKLDDLINAKTLDNVYETWTPNWDNPTAQNEMDGALSKNANNIQIAYVANDGMAGTVIASLKTQHLNGKVLVTGQDATAQGIQNILKGDQAMTVYKPIVNEAQATAKLIADLNKGSVPSTDAPSTLDNGSKQVPSMLLPVQSIDKSNVQKVIDDGYVSKADACQGVPAGAAPSICG
jgi:D-xylose transport system substrate-binding protein